MKVLFKVYPQRSHYNATFSLAMKLKEEGHLITYAGLKPLRKHVESQGISFIEEPEDVFSYAENALPGCENSTLSLTLRSFFYLRSYAKLKWNNYDPFSAILKEQKFDFVMVDSPYAFFALRLFKHGVKFGILESMMPQGKDPNCPPLSSMFVPNEKWWSKYYCEFLWQKYLFKRWALGATGMRPDYNKRNILDLAAKSGIDPSNIELDRYFHIGVRNVPEYLLAPLDLDFSRKLRPNQIPSAFTDPKDRKEVCGDWMFEKQFQKMVSERPEKRLIYCSQGTAGWRYKGAIKFLQKVVKAASGRSDWNLILSIGNLDREKLGEIPKNVAVFQFVPQLQVLESCDLMITHGGMNSIRECYDRKVPMLVYPGTHAIDQAGNAARVVYHELGLAGTMRRESVLGLKKKVFEILSGEFKLPKGIDPKNQRNQTHHLDPHNPTNISQIFPPSHETSS